MKFKILWDISPEGTDLTGQCGTCQILHKNCSCSIESRMYVGNHRLFQFDRAHYEVVRKLGLEKLRGEGY